MNQRDDFLVEILTEELPPKALLGLAQYFKKQVEERLQKLEVTFEQIDLFATPRRLALLVKNLVAMTQDQRVDRKGPARLAAFDAAGKPTPACEGFARSCGVTVAELQVIKTPQGEWMGYQQAIPGKSVIELLPGVIEQALAALPIAKRMRWGSGDVQFVRPVHAVVMLYGDQTVPATILGCEAGRLTRGHRFHAPDWLSIPNAAAYVDLMEKQGRVMVDFAKRRDKIVAEAQACASIFISSDEFLNEVTGLVEWPVALQGQFDQAFLALPKEVLISSMQDHQRYFPVLDKTKHQLSPHFVTISNIESHDKKRVIQGNERVLRARLSDAAFFYESDKQERLEQRLERLKGIVFQAKLGTLYEKAERLSKLSEWIAEKTQMNTVLAARAGLLAKADLTTGMVNEFPELQGEMGGYYAIHDGEPTDVAEAIKEHYQPRFSGDVLPASALGRVVSLADKIDILVGTFGINQIPTGDKDPYGLRRMALGVLRIIIENKINLDMKEMLALAAQLYGGRLENPDVISAVWVFIQERLRVWYQDQGVSADVFAAVAAVHITNLLDMHERVKAVQAFKKLREADALSAANKRVMNILAKCTDRIVATTVNQAFFESAIEQALAEQLELKSQAVARLYQLGQYDQVLLQLADLRQPVDDFFEQVMVMTEDMPRRENRLLLLVKLRALFLQVADIALLN